MALSDGLVGYWSPWLGSSGYRLLDRTRYANHGTLENMDATDWVGSTIRGRSGSSIELDGVNDWVSASSRPIGVLTQNVSVSVWFTVSATGRTSTLYSVNAATNLNQRCQAIAPWSDNNIYFDFGGSSGANRLTITGQSWPLNSWNHMVFVAGVSGMRVWRNGLLIGSSTTAVTRSASSNIFYIGGSIADNVGNPNYYHQGLIAETAVFARETNNAEALELYRLGPGWYRPYAKRSIGYAAAQFNRRRRILCGDYN